MLVSAFCCLCLFLVAPSVCLCRMCDVGFRRTTFSRKMSFLPTVITLAFLLQAPSPFPLFALTVFSEDWTGFPIHLAWVFVFALAGFSLGVMRSTSLGLLAGRIPSGPQVSWLRTRHIGVPVSSQP